MPYRLAIWIRTSPPYRVVRAISFSTSRARPLVQVLKHGVRKNEVGGVVTKGHVARVGDEKRDAESELARDPSPRESGVQRRIDRDDAVTKLRCGQ